MESIPGIVHLLVYALIWVHIYAKTPNKSYPGEQCQRECYKNDSRTCYFKFVMEYYQTFGFACYNCTNGNDSDCDLPECIVADGFEKGLLSINRQLPGPPIQICRNDVVVVDLENKAEGTATAIHWHGIDQREHPYMDGVPFVTQCPIPFATTFRYQFPVRDTGTYFYHSHSGLQRVNGVYGAFIVREPSKIKDPYDFDLPEHHIFISDWLHSYAEQLFPSITQDHGNNPDSLLINGRGTYINAATGKRENVPPPRYFFVEAGKSYRFRVINGGSFACVIQLQVEKHTLNLIASDGHRFEPRTFDTLMLNAGERYDFVLSATQPPGDYWIRVQGLGFCGLTEAFVLLRYKTNNATDLERAPPAMPSYDDAYPAGTVLNYPNTTCLDQGNDFCVTALHALKTDESLLLGKVDKKFYLGFNNYKRNISDIFGPGIYEKYINIDYILPEISAINNISSKLPSSPPLTQPHDVDKTEYCDKDHRPARCDGDRFCECIHRIRIPLGSTVELILVDESDVIFPIHHPFHLHGMDFMVVDMGQHPLGERMTVSKAKIMETTNILRRKNVNLRPVWKDTISIPNYGFAIVRFRALNPGYWFLHCHYEWHMANGMTMIVQIGEQNEMKSPPHDFPKCGNYLPRIS